MAVFLPIQQSLCSLESKTKTIKARVKLNEDVVD
jgi:hypothetical protein